MRLDARRRLAERRSGGSERRDGDGAIRGRESPRREAELDQVVVRILGVDRVAPAVIDLEDVATRSEPAVLPADKLVGGRDREGDVVDEVRHARSAGEVRFEVPGARDVVQLPEGDEPR